MNQSENWLLWSSKLSPFGIKVDAMLRQAEIPFKWAPEDCDFFSAIKAVRRILMLKKGRLPLTWPPENSLQEFPAVPYLLGPSGENLFDSSAIAQWLVKENPELPLLPPTTSAEGFVVQLIDEALDEFGLYMVHHNRWVNAAADNNAGERLATEMSSLFGPPSYVLRKFFPIRQTRRLPYLFSVAEPQTDYSHLPRKLRPPCPEGFPPTHQLLDQAFSELLAAVEGIYSSRAYLLGDQLTLADASILGQLGMNKTDPSAWSMILEQAPATARWIDNHYLTRVDSPSTGYTTLFDDLRPLLHWCCRYFVPLMQQNYSAYQHYRKAGERLFNEAAFDRQRSLYQGQIAGKKFKSVVKTFQVLSWTTVHQQWQLLPTSEKDKLTPLLPDQHGLESLSDTINLSSFD